MMLVSTSCGQSWRRCRSWEKAWWVCCFVTMGIETDLMGDGFSIASSSGRCTATFLQSFVQIYPRICHGHRAINDKLKQADTTCGATTDWWPPHLSLMLKDQPKISTGSNYLLLPIKRHRHGFLPWLHHDKIWIAQHFAFASKPKLGEASACLDGCMYEPELQAFPSEISTSSLVFKLVKVSQACTT